MVNQKVGEDLGWVGSLVGFVEREMGMAFKMKMEGMERA